MGQLELGFNSRPLSSKLDQIVRAAPKSRTQAALAMVEQMAGALDERSPKDSNRYVRAWLQAVNDLGIRVPIPVLRVSKHRKELAEVLALQVSKIAAHRARLAGQKEHWYDRVQRKPDKFYRKLERGIRKADERLAKAQEQARACELDENAIVMMRGSSAALAGYQRHLSGDALMATIRQKVYGGAGRLANTQTATIILLHNMEPYARALEKRHHVFRGAADEVRHLGMRRVGAKFFGKLAAESGGLVAIST